MKAQVTHHPVTILDLEFSLVLGEKVEDCIKAYEKEFPDIDKSFLGFNGNHEALALQHVSRIKDRGEQDYLVTIMFLPKESSKLRDYTIMHESLHIAYFLLSYAGINVDVDNHEILARTQEFVYRTVQKEILKWKKG